MSPTAPATAAGAGSWSGVVTDGQQPRRPVRIGIGLALGVVLWLAPYLGVNAVLLPAKVAELDPDGKAGVIALLATSAMIVATIANVFFGALSDLTRSRWGRRTPWIVFGSVASAVMLVVVGAMPTVTLLVIAWCVYQFFLNAIVAPLIAVIADRVAPRHRGTIASIYALGYSAGLYGGQIVGAQFLGALTVGFLLMAVLTLLSGPVAAFVIREPSSLGMPRRRLDRDMLLENFTFPRHRARDYYLALFGKFLVMAATFGVSSYQLYILTDYMGQDEDGTKAYISLISLCLMVTALLMAAVAGPVADKIRRIKLPVVVASLLIAVGVLIPAFAAQPWTLIAYGVIAGIGIGAFNAVDQALNVEVLPNPGTAAKDLGILNLANTGGQILGPLLAAAAISMAGYQAIFPIACVLALVGAGLITLIRSVR
ncbi:MULTISPECIES: MFS transporter [unclassified Microbacterium]|uniref:MFS transporter n=1 Tax=unclassified Microbacterium TaxID=2609290 RepID=UPI0030184960